jgi:hypothetical protein
MALVLLYFYSEPMNGEFLIEKYGEFSIIWIILFVM